MPPFGAIILKKRARFCIFLRKAVFLRRKSNDRIVDLLNCLTNYLATHKRLVVPQLGVFLVKEPGRSVVFSELMKRDDGVLRGLLCAGGLSEVEAAGRIDRLVFEVRQAVERGESYPLPGFGTMQPGPNGTIAFVYAPAASEETVLDAAPAAEPEPAIPATPVAPVVTEPAPASVTPADEDAETADSEPVEAPVAPSHIDTARMAEKLRTAFREESDDPDDSEEELPAAPKPAAPRRKPAYTLEEAYADHKPPKRKVDRFLLLAVVAGVLALAAIAFGFWREAQEEREAEESLSNGTEWVEDTDPSF